jgi:hypothetical protein
LLAHINIVLISNCGLSYSSVFVEKYSESDGRETISVPGEKRGIHRDL